jgi:hypothetical protein
MSMIEEVKQKRGRVTEKVKLGMGGINTRRNKRKNFQK